MWTCAEGRFVVTTPKAFRFFALTFSNSSMRCLLSAL